MIRACLPDNEQERLKALGRYGILDTAPERDFDDLVLMAAQICGTPISLLSLIDEDRQWFKAKIGLAITQTPRDLAFCAHAILQRDLFIIHDACADERFSANPLVTSEPHIRFYAGAPLITSDGYALGTLCVMDRVPRELSPEQAETLRLLSRRVISQLEWRNKNFDLARAVTESQAALEALRESEEFKTRLIECSRDCLKVLDLEGRLLTMNAGGMAVLEICDLAPVIGSSWIDFWEGEDRQAAQAAVETARQGGVGRFTGFFATTQTRTPKWWDVMVSPLRNADGRPENLLAASRDVTETKRAQALLNAIIAGTSTVTGKEFFRPLVENLAKGLGVRYSFVAECLPMSAPGHWPFGRATKPARNSSMTCAARPA
jgi:PAS domain S-box-containing protein